MKIIKEFWLPAVVFAAIIVTLKVFGESFNSSRDAKLTCELRGGSMVRGYCMGVVGP
jgi:hypothetical protein